MPYDNEHGAVTTEEGNAEDVTWLNRTEAELDQGQSFSTLSGDSDAYMTGSNSMNGVDNPSLANSSYNCPFITVVG